MNGVHDMGGMHGMGAINPRHTEPVFHTRWEARIFALRRAMSAWRRWNVDATRHSVELIPAAQYLHLGYYQRQFEAFLTMLVKVKLVSAQEIHTGLAASDQPRATPALTIDRARALIAQGAPCDRESTLQQRFHIGQSVHTLNLNPCGHTRLPRYARDKIGCIDRYHGVFVFADSNAHFLGEQPQPLYCVRFAARELWGQQASALDSVCLDLWESYLEPA